MTNGYLKTTKPDGCMPARFGCSIDKSGVKLLRWLRRWGRSFPVTAGHGFIHHAFVAQGLVAGFKQALRAGIFGVQR